MPRDKKLPLPSPRIAPKYSRSQEQTPTHPAVPIVRDALTKQDNLHTLPLVSVLPTTDLVQEVTELLERGQSYDELMKDYEKEQDKIKSRLKEVLAENSLQGIRSGRAAYVLTPSSRSTLKKELLIESGVDPQVISACTITTPVVMGKFHVIVG